MGDEVTISPVRDAAGFAAVRILCREFLDWNRVRYAELDWLLQRYYEPAKWEAYLERLEDLFAPPEGEILLARSDEEPVGCVMLRRIDGSACEMKHLFVRDRARSAGVGFELCLSIMGIASRRGSLVMRLETGIGNNEACALYRRLGFVPCAPWQAYPEDVRALLRFMSVDLVQPPR